MRDAAIERPASLDHSIVQNGQRSAARPVAGHDHRPDIDALRAIAVLLVIGFHAFPGLVPGGFIGVDIFFVISGFLISSIVIAECDAGRFSFAGFYARRIRRIFPALLLVLAFCAAMGWGALFAGERAFLGKHMAAGAFFASNFVFWSESGYFDASALGKPLLHLWSLGIEEQFYVAWPLALFAIHRRRWPILAALLPLAAVSFAINIADARGSPVAAFYSPLARAWELGAGGILAALQGGRIAVPPRRWTWPLGPLGAGLLLLGIAFIDRTRAFPGWWAPLPVLGTTLLIAAGPAGIVNRALSRRTLAWIGKISYPLYLWHWPLLSFAAIVFAEDRPSFSHRAIAIALSVALAWLTYACVERPIRRAAPTAPRILGLTAALAAFGAAGLACFVHGGFPTATPSAQEKFAADFENAPPDLHYQTRVGYAENARDRCNFYDIEAWRRGRETRKPRDAIAPDCTERDPTKRKAAFIWGDSHAQHLNIGLQRTLPADWQILQVASSSCAASIDDAAPSDTDWCARSNWTALRAIARDRPDVVLIAQNTGHDAGTMRRIATRLAELGVGRAIFLGPTPHWAARLPDLVLRRMWTATPRRTMEGILGSVISENERLRLAFDAHNGRAGAGIASFADAIGEFCDRDGCLVYLGDDKTSGLTSWDYGHLTPIASEYLARRLLAPMILDGSPGPSGSIGGGEAMGRSISGQ